MKVLGKILLVLAGLVLLAGAIAAASTFIAIPWLSQFVGAQLQSYPWLAYCLAGVLGVFALTALVFIIVVLAYPGKRNVYVLARSMGRIDISRHSIESAAGCTLKGIEGIKRYYVHVHRHPGPHKLKLNIQVEAKEGAGLAAMGDEIQNRVKADLEQSLGIRASHIHVRICPAPRPETAREAAHSNIPRVV